MSRLQTLLTELPNLIIPLAELESFTIFSKLPPELRARVWHFAALQPSEILFFENIRGFAGECKQPNGPAILYACRESHEEAKRYYTPCPVTKMPLLSDTGLLYIGRPPPMTVAPGKRTIRINFDVDTLVFGKYFLGWTAQTLPLGKAFNLENSVMDRIQHLVIMTEADGQMLNYLYSLEDLLRHGNLKSLVVKLMVMVETKEHVNLSHSLRLIGRGYEKKIAEIGRHSGWAAPTVVEVLFKRNLDLMGYDA